MPENAKWARQDYLDGRVSHHEFYLDMARTRGIALTETDLRIFGLKSKEELVEKLKRDEHLNNIPLACFDALTSSFNAYHPKQRLTLAEGCCTFKALLIEVAK